MKCERNKKGPPADLAKMSQVSHRWLEQAAPLLYEAIEVDEVQAGKLFCGWVYQPTMIQPALTYLKTANISRTGRHEQNHRTILELLSLTQIKNKRLTHQNSQRFATYVHTYQKRDVAGLGWDRIGGYERKPMEIASLSVAFYGLE